MQEHVRRFRAGPSIADKIDVGVAYVTCDIVGKKCRPPSANNPHATTAGM